MSFLLDLMVLLPSLGIVIALICKRFYKKDSFLEYWLSFLFLGLFYIVSIAIFCDYGFGILNNATEFMYSSGIFEVPFHSFEELALKQNRLYVFLGVFLFCLYPCSLYVGLHLGYALFGRKKEDKGMLWFLI